MVNKIGRVAGKKGGLLLGTIKNFPRELLRHVTDYLNHLVMRSKVDEYTLVTVPKLAFKKRRYRDA